MKTTKWLVIPALLALSTPAVAQTAGLFSQGSMNSTTTTEQTIEETISIERFGSKLETWSGHNVAERRDKQHVHDVLDSHSGRRLSAGNHKSRSGYHRDRGHRANNRNNFYHYVVIGLLQVISFASPVRAQVSDGTTVIANPQASSTGSVTNSAVQINQGSYSTQGFASGHYCNSGTVVFTPFYLGGDFHPQYTRSQSFGAQISFSVPLDGSITEICKELGLKKFKKNV